MNYDFGGRLKKEFPSQIIVDATEVCNLACIHCPHPEFKKSPYYSSAYLDPELNKKMVDEVKEFGKNLTQYIRYTSNGEPLVHPKIYDMLTYAVENSGCLVTLTTNGKILNEARVEKLFQSGIHLIDISIDAYSAEVYSQIRVGGQLDVTKKNVQTLIRLRNLHSAKTKIVVSFVEQEQNTHEVLDFENFWKNEGADEVVIRRLHSAAGQVKHIKDNLDKNSTQDRYPCLYPWERVLLNPKGEIAFCPQDWTHGSAIAHYSQTTIKDVWQGTFYNNLRNAHKSCNFKGFDFCGNCPDWQQTRWPGMGRSYADMVEEFKEQLK